MLSSKKKFLKKALKGSIIFILVFITASFVATKFIYDSIFQRYDSLEETSYQVTQSFNSVTFPCGDHTLSGNVYHADEKRPLVVIVPGFHADMNDYRGPAEAFFQEGFDVFLFDATGSGESGGDSYIGFPQILIDLNSALDYIDNELDYDEIFLFGHSRGAYGALCVINEKDIGAVVSVSGVNSAMEAVMARSVDAVGPVAYGNYPFLRMYQNFLFGNETANKNASEEIAKTSVPVLVIQGANDDVFPPDEYSVYSYREETKNAEYLLYEKPGHDGHTDILFDEQGSVNSDLISQVISFFKENTVRE